MEVIHYPEQLPVSMTAVTVGFFDGVHLGHRFLIERLVKEAHDRGQKAVVVTFVDHPRKVTLSSYQPALLSSLEEKLSALNETEADYCYVIDFTKELSSLTAREFMINVLIDKLHACDLLLGYDHRFGSDRLQGVEVYQAMAAPLGIEVAMGEVYEQEGVYLSSSTIRRALQQGQVKRAHQMLGRNYRIVGKVVHGMKMGRKMGFPTVNLLLTNNEKLVPANGVYFVRVLHQQFAKYGMMNIGNRPSLYIEGALTLEIHLFDFEGDIYEAELTVEFLDYIRPEQSFASIDELIAQLKIDHYNCQQLISKQFK